MIAGQDDTAESDTTCVSPFVLDMVSAALLPPRVVDWNETSAVVDVPAEITEVAGAPTLKSDALAPAIANGGASVTGADALFAMVTTAVASEPRATEPKPVGLGVTDSAGAITLARFCGALGAISWKSLTLSFVSTPLPLAPPGFRSYP